MIIWSCFFLIGCDKRKSSLYPYNYQDLYNVCDDVYNILSEEGLEGVDEHTLVGAFKDVEGMGGYSVFLALSVTNNGDSEVVLLLPAVSTSGDYPIMNLYIKRDPEMERALTGTTRSDLIVEGVNKSYLIKFNEGGVEAVSCSKCIYDGVIKRLKINKILLAD